MTKCFTEIDEGNLKKKKYRNLQEEDCYGENE